MIVTSGLSICAPCCDVFIIAQRILPVNGHKKAGTGAGSSESAGSGSSFHRGMLGLPLSQGSIGRLLKRCHHLSGHRLHRLGRGLTAWPAQPILQHVADEHFVGHSSDVSRLAGTGRNKHRTTIVDGDIGTLDQGSFEHIVSFCVVCCDECSITGSFLPVYLNLPGR